MKQTNTAYSIHSACKELDRVASLLQDQMQSDFMEEQIAMATACFINQLEEIDALASEHIAGKKGSMKMVRLGRNLKELAREYLAEMEDLADTSNRNGVVGKRIEQIDAEMAEVTVNLSVSIPLTFLIQHGLDSELFTDGEEVLEDEYERIWSDWYGLSDNIAELIDIVCAI